jgi:hypothetical protein
MHKPHDDAISNSRARMRVRIPATRGARVMPELCPSQRKRAQGKPGVRCTRGPTCKGRKHVGRHHRFTGPVRLSLRNGFNGFFRALPGDRALLPPSPCGLAASPTRLGRNSPPQDLTPASGRQDHTTSPSAATSFVCAPDHRSQVRRTSPAISIGALTLPRPPHPAPRP